MLVLEKPCMKHAAAVMAFRTAFFDAGEQRINGSCGLHHSAEYTEWLQKVAAFEKAETSPLGVAGTTWLSLRQPGGALVGIIQLRHSLTSALRHSGGHIGYAVHPAFRRQGVATRQLAMAVRAAEAMGIARPLLLTCDDDNPASYRTIEKNGGVLAEVFTNSETGKIERRYHI